MPFDTNDTVLVTGANGHVGSHLVHVLLQDPQAPKVRAAVRTTDSAEPLRAVFGSHLEGGRLTVTYVPDITSPGAYDGAVKGVTHIAHVASPLILDPPGLEQDLLKPAIGGAVGLLESASKSDSVKSVVMTSSFAAVFNPVRGWADTHTYTSDEWSPLTYEQGAGRESVEGIDPKYQGFMPYMSSKKLAEEAAWSFYEENVAGRKGAWQFSTVLPTYIAGPCVLPLKGDGGIDGKFQSKHCSEVKLIQGFHTGYSFSQKMIVNLFKQRTNRRLIDDFPFWIDVRDVAQAHIQALLRPEAANKRWVLACQKARMWQIARAMQRQFPKQGMEIVEEKDESFDIDCAESLVGLDMEKWIGLDQMVRDTVAPVADMLV